MPLQVPQWTDYLVCPVCENNFELKTRLPISLGCGHSVCKTCLSNLQRSVCPFDQAKMTISLDKLPVNTALALLIDPHFPRQNLLSKFTSDLVTKNYDLCMTSLEKLALYLKPSTCPSLSRPLQRKLVNLINCQFLEEDGRLRAIRQAKSLCERSVTELILQHQNPQQLSTNLWAAVRTRGCQFLGPAMQEEVLKLVLLALEDGSALSRKVLVMFVVQRLEPLFPQASKTSIGHVVQLLYRASCFIVMKRDGDSSLMQLKDEFRSYETLRREHDAQIVQIAMEAGLRIAPDQWSSLLYGDTNHKSHMQSIIDKLQTPQSFSQSIQELVIALQRTGDPGKLTSIRHDLDQLSAVDVNAEASKDWETLEASLTSCLKVLNGLVSFITNHSSKRNSDPQSSVGNHTLRFHQKQNRNNQSETCSSPRPISVTSTLSFSDSQHQTPVAQVAPVPREFVPNPHRTMLNQVLHHSPSHVQIPPPSIDSFHQIPFMHHNVARTVTEIVHNLYSGFVPSIRPLQQQQVHPHQAVHVRLQQYIPAETPVATQGTDSLTEMHRQSAVAQAKTMCSLATRSLSALKSRREEIIDNLEDLVGKDETKKISNLTTERANTLQNLQNVTDERGQYSMWSPQYLPPQMGNLVNVPSEQENVRFDDEIIPFADTPQISRFGPISRRNICPQSVPTQSQAIIGDDTMPTTMVRHAKHMSRPMAAPAALINQNGTRTTLQPVAVGANGEIGYIAIQEPPIAVGAVAAAADMHHIHQSSLINPIQRQFSHHHPGMLIEPDRIKQLQFQLSNVNLSHMSNQSESYYRDPVMGEREQLTSELQLIENTIQDREREIKVNQMINVSKDVEETLIPTSQGQMQDGYSSITTTAKLGQATSSGRNVSIDSS